MGENRGDCRASQTSSPDPRGKASGSHPSPHPAVPAPREDEELSVCTSSCMPASMQRSAGWRVDQFELHKQVYEGRTSRLYLATDIQSGTPVALKLYRKRKLTALNRIQVEREINIHVTLGHENIIKLYAAFEDDKNVYLVLEVAEAGDLFHHVKTSAGQQYSERKAVQHVIIPFLRAMTYLHDKGIIHRDIKPENILISSSGVLKLADFGLAIDLSEERPVTRLGTLDYMAPEVLLCPDKKLPEENKDRSDLIYSSQVDVWALGILTYEILSGRAPFERDSRMETYEHILKKEPEYPSCISEEAKRFIKATLVKDPTRRPSASSLLDHPWIRSFRRGSHTHSASANNLKGLASAASASGPQDIPGPAAARAPHDTSARHPAELSHSLTTPAPLPWADLHVLIQAPQGPSPKHRLSSSTSPEAANAARPGHCSATHASASAHTSIFQPDGPLTHSSSSQLSYYNSSIGFDRQGSASHLAVHNQPSGPMGDQSPRSKQGQGSSSQQPHFSPDSSSSAAFRSASSQNLCQSPDASVHNALPRLSTKASQSSPISLPSVSSSSFTKPRSGVLSCDQSLIKMGDSMMSLGLAALLSPTPREPSQPCLSSGQLQLSSQTSSTGTPQRKVPSKPTPLAKGLSSMSLGLAALLNPGAKKKPAPPPINVSCGGSMPTRLGTASKEGWLPADPDRSVSSSSQKPSTRSFPARLFSPGAGDASRGRADGLAFQQLSGSASDLQVHLQSEPLPSAPPPHKMFSSLPAAPYDSKPPCLSPPASLGRPKSLRSRIQQEQLVPRTDSAPGLVLRSG